MGIKTVKDLERVNRNTWEMYLKEKKIAAVSVIASQEAVDTLIKDVSEFARQEEEKAVMCGDRVVMEVAKMIAARFIKLTGNEKVNIEVVLNEFKLATQSNVDSHMWYALHEIKGAAFDIVYNGKAQLMRAKIKTRIKGFTRFAEEQGIVI